MKIEMNETLPSTSSAYELFQPVTKAPQDQAKQGHGWIAVNLDEIPGTNAQSKQSLMSRVARSFDITIQTRSHENKLFLRMKPEMKGVNVALDTNAPELPVEDAPAEANQVS